MVYEYKYLEIFLLIWDYYGCVYLAGFLCFQSMFNALFELR